MYTPFQYQTSEYDCVPTALVNARIAGHLSFPGNLSGDHQNLHVHDIGARGAGNQQIIQRPEKGV